MTYPEKTRTRGAYHLHEKSRNSGWKIKIEMAPAIPFGELQKI